MLTGIVREYGQELLHCDYSQWGYCRMAPQHEEVIITGDEVFDFATYCGGEHVPIFGITNFNMRSTAADDTADQYVGVYNDSNATQRSAARGRNARGVLPLPLS